jgi:hypothetical protein
VKSRCNTCVLKLILTKFDEHLVSSISCFVLLCSFEAPKTAKLIPPSLCIEDVGRISVVRWRGQWEKCCLRGREHLSQLAVAGQPICDIYFEERHKICCAWRATDTIASRIGSSSSVNSSLCAPTSIVLIRFITDPSSHAHITCKCTCRHCRF